MFRHVVLFLIYDNVADETVSAAKEMLERLASEPGITEWHVELSSDRRKGRILIEDGTFLDLKWYTRYRNSAAHSHAASMMSEISDWHVGDYSLNPFPAGEYPI